MKINILGTEYDFELTTEKEDSRLCECDGYCDFTEKKIAVETEYNENAPNSISNFEVLGDRVKRHEIIHAFFYESGLIELAENEQFIDWIAVQFPKLLKVFNDVDCLE